MFLNRFRCISLAAFMSVVYCTAANSSEPAHLDDEPRIFSGEPRLLIVHGYSTSAHWWAFLQRKIDRYMQGSDNRVVEVQLCNKGGTPIARWMNVTTGEPSDAWTTMLTPMIQREKGVRPVVVLCQQSLQSVYSPQDQSAGIRGPDDQERIERGANVIEQYGKRILDDGAAFVVIGMHIYKRSMEPAIGHERLALARLMSKKPDRIYAGPDVWTPTSKQFPLAFDTDKAHPNFIGAEIMAQYWFEALLTREGLEVPDWSRQEMDEAIRTRSLGLTRDRQKFQEWLTEWKITRRSPSAGSDNLRRPQGARAPAISQRILDRYDTDGDGSLNQTERARFERALQQRQRQQQTDRAPQADRSPTT